MHAVFSAPAVFGLLIGISSLIAGTPQQDPRYGKLPLEFEKNVGQTAADVSFLARGQGYSVLIRGSKAELLLRNGSSSAKVALSIPGARPGKAALGGTKLPGYSNYFVGSDRSKWLKDVPHYSDVKVSDVKEGVDLIFHGAPQGLEYDFNVAPGADTSDLQLRVEGADSLSLDTNGDLLIHTSAGDVREHKPVAWQEANGRKQPVDVRHELLSSGDVALRIGIHDSGLPLVIDPVVTFASYLGGGTDDLPTAVTVDSSGNVYVAGITQSLDFPVTSGKFRGGYQDGFISKINSTGTALVYSVYLGGSSTDSIWSIAVDSTGSAYVTGDTNSSDFPVVFGGASVFASYQDSFVSKLDGSGVLQSSRFITSNQYVSGHGGASITVDSTNAVYVVGTTVSNSLAVTTGSFLTTKPSAAGTASPYLAKLDSSLNTIYATYLGGTANDSATAVAVDSTGRAYVVGQAFSANFPTTPDAFQKTYAALGDVFLVVVNAQGNALAYSTYLGGASADVPTSVALDPFGNVFIAGNTSSTNFPTTDGSFSTTNTAFFLPIGFVTKLRIGGPTLIYSTYLPAPITGLAVDSSSNAYVVGTANFGAFPATPGALKTPASATNNVYGNNDIYVLELPPLGQSLIYSTFFGSSLNETGIAAAIDNKEGLIVIGSSTNQLFPVTSGAFQPVSGNSSYYNSTGVVFRIDFSSPTLCDIELASNSTSVPGHGGSGTVAFTVASGCPWEITNDSPITITTPVKGYGSGVVGWSVGVNANTYYPQVNTITVNGGVLKSGTNTFKITEAAGSCTDPVFDNSNLSFAATGGLRNVVVGLPAGCNWNLTSDAPWITTSNSVGSAGSGTLSIAAAPNSFSYRTGNITVASKVITVSEFNGICRISLNVQSASFPAQAGQGSVGITTGTNCSWAMYSSVPWIVFTSPSGPGQGNGTATYQIANNPSSFARTATLTIGDQTVQVAQGAGSHHRTHLLYNLCGNH